MKRPFWKLYFAWLGGQQRTTFFITHLQVMGWSSIVPPELSSFAHLSVWILVYSFDSRDTRNASYTVLGGGFKYFLFSSLFGEMIEFTNIFHMGWNHQLAVSIGMKYDLMDLHPPHCYLPKGEVGSFSVKPTLDSSGWLKVKYYLWEWKSIPSHKQLIAQKIWPEIWPHKDVL